jgi:hypothetical protein
LEFDAITSLAIGPGPAALVDVCYVPVAQNATRGWTPIAEFSYPLTLPVTHPDYPCRSGPDEKLDTMRDLAKSRVHYGDANAFTAAGPSFGTTGSIAVSNGSPIVVGVGTAWNESVLGGILRVAGDSTAYTIIMVIGPEKLALSRAYVGASVSGAAYTIGEDPFGGLHDYLVHLVRGGSVPAMADRVVPPAAASAGSATVTRDSAAVAGAGTNWTSALEGFAFQLADEDVVYAVGSVETATALTLDRAYQGDSATANGYGIGPLLQPTESDSDPPRMSSQSPLDLVLLGTLHPALAQMVGVYWIDERADPEIAHDYLLLADYDGRFFEMGPHKTVAEIADHGFGQAEAYIVFNKRIASSPNLAAPANLRVFALPGGTRLDATGNLQEATNAAGLTWDHVNADLTAPLPDRPIMFHVWRAKAGTVEPASPLPADEHALLTVRPVVVTAPPDDPPQRPSNWPPFAMHALDQALPEGWYSYQVSGIDIFGRHSANSAPAAWHQWAPPPDPRPWYYVEPPGDRLVHGFAVRLLDKIPPPPPAAFEAYALDPADPTIRRDAVYDAWRAALLPGEEDQVVGLRARWIWTDAQMRQAPDTREFRLYVHAGTNPPAQDASVPANWDTRVHVIGFDEHVSVGVDADGRPVRVYELLLPRPADANRNVVPLTPTLAEPLVFGHVAVSAADDKTHTADHPTWNGTPFGNHTGNEGHLTAPAKIFRVRREPPAPPGVPPADSDRIFATAADYQGHSYYTYRWKPRAHLKTHVWRALDDALFKIDWQRRLSPVPDLSAAQEHLFPEEWRGTNPDLVAKREQIAAALNHISGFADYRQLSNDALRVLAGLPDNDDAFVQLTVLPLDPADPATANRLGPDDPKGFAIDTALRIFVDTLDGRSTNGYFYRATYVDGAHNTSAASLASPPVYCPNVVPPRVPVLTKAQGGDRQITLRWNSNREADLAAYRIYRAESAESSADVRLMTEAATVVVTPGDPALRPAEVEWTDLAVKALVPLHYRIAAVDDAGNVSNPSPPVAVQAHDDSRPAPPLWGPSTPANGGLQLSWTLADTSHVALVQRRDPTAYPPEWTNVTSWLAADTQLAIDTTRIDDRTYVYRIRVRDAGGVTNRDFVELEI